MKIAYLPPVQSRKRLLGMLALPLASILAVSLVLVARANRFRVALAAVAAVAFIAGAIIFWIQVTAARRAAVCDSQGEDRRRARIGLPASLLYAVTACILVIGGTLTLVQLLVTNDKSATESRGTGRGQVSDRFASAMGRLRGENVATRLSAVYEMDKIAQEAPDYAEASSRALVSLVRERLSATEDDKRRLTPDVRVAIESSARIARSAPFFDPPDFSRLDLSEGDFLGADLSFANLAGANLSNAKLSRANLFGATLTNASLSGADVSGANLAESNVGGIYAYSVKLTYANLSGAYLQGAFLQAADLSDANLVLADLSNANITGVNMSNANLSSARLFRANAANADFTNADLSMITGANASSVGADASGANLSGANLSNANLLGAVLFETNLSRANLSGADLSRAVLRRRDLTPSQAKSAKHSNRIVWIQ